MQILDLRGVTDTRIPSRGGRQIGIIYTKLKTVTLGKKHFTLKADIIGLFYQILWPQFGWNECKRNLSFWFMLIQSCLSNFEPYSMILYIFTAWPSEEVVNSVPNKNILHQVAYNFKAHSTLRLEPQGPTHKIHSIKSGSSVKLIVSYHIYQIHVFSNIVFKNMYKVHDEISYAVLKLYFMIYKKSCTCTIKLGWSIDCLFYLLDVYN